MERDSSLLHLCIDSLKCPFFRLDVIVVLSLGCSYMSWCVLCSHSRVVVVMCIVPSVAIDH